MRRCLTGLALAIVVPGIASAEARLGGAGTAPVVVWQQGRDGFEPAGDFRFSHVGNVLEADATNVFLVKFSRWFNF